MKFWKKFKIKFNKNKRFRMWTIITLILGIATLISGFIAGVQKDGLDNIDKGKDDEFKKEILKSTKKTEFNTDCTRFFEEHKEFERYSNFFEQGYLVILQNEDGSLCKKSYGKKYYTDFCSFKLYKKDDYYFLNHKIEYIQNMFNQGGTISGIKLDDTAIDIELIGEPQKIRGGIGIELPNNKKIINAVIIIKNKEPFVYAFGLIERDRIITHYKYK